MTPKTPPLRAEQSEAIPIEHGAKSFLSAAAQQSESPDSFRSALGSSADSSNGGFSSSLDSKGSGSKKGKKKNRGSHALEVETARKV